MCTVFSYNICLFYLSQGQLEQMAPAGSRPSNLKNTDNKQRQTTAVNSQQQEKNKQQQAVDSGDNKSKAAASVKSSSASAAPAELTRVRTADPEANGGSTITSRGGGVEAANIVTPSVPASSTSQKTQPEKQQPDNQGEGADHGTINKANGGVQGPATAQPPSTPGCSSPATGKSPRRHRKSASVNLEMGIKNMEVVDDDTVDQTVEILKRPGQTLGFYIREGNGFDRQDGVFISRIASGSVVENNGLLRVSDEIMTVNNVDVTRISLDDVVILMSIPKRLVLTIRTRRNCSKNNSCPSLANMEQEEPQPVVVVKKGRSSSASALEMTEKCPDEFILAGTDARACYSQHAPQYTQKLEDGKRTKCKAPLPPGYKILAQAGASIPGERVNPQGDDSGDSGLSSDNSGLSRTGDINSQQQPSQLQQQQQPLQQIAQQQSQQLQQHLQGIVQIHRNSSDLEQQQQLLHQQYQLQQAQHHHHQQQQQQQPQQRQQQLHLQDSSPNSSAQNTLSRDSSHNKLSPKVSPRESAVTPVSSGANFRSPLMGRRAPSYQLDYSSDSDTRLLHDRPSAGGRLTPRYYDHDTIKAFQEEIERTHYKYEGGYVNTRHRYSKTQRQVSPDRYNSDSEVLNASRGQIERPVASLGGLASPMKDPQLSHLLDGDQRSNSVPLIEARQDVNSQELRHWLKKFDSLSNELQHALDVGAEPLIQARSTASPSKYTTWIVWY